MRSVCTGLARQARPCAHAARCSGPCAPSEARPATHAARCLAARQGAPWPRVARARQAGPAMRMAWAGQRAPMASAPRAGTYGQARPCAPRPGPVRHAARPAAGAAPSPGSHPRTPEARLRAALSLVTPAPARTYSRAGHRTRQDIYPGLPLPPRRVLPAAAPPPGPPEPRAPAQRALRAASVVAVGSPGVPAGAPSRRAHRNRPRGIFTGRTIIPVDLLKDIAPGLLAIALSVLAVVILGILGWLGPG